MTAANDIDHFMEWFQTADPGEKYIYYTGFLAEDFPSGRGNVVTVTAYELATKNQIQIVQKRVSQGKHRHSSVFRYIAQKSAA